eukprot:m.63336 g.63336  ORF g.63336 m.63336 type:complete len:466 (+) comp23269_c1_seq1:185-1582(+)
MASPRSHRRDSHLQQQKSKLSSESTSIPRESKRSSSKASANPTLSTGGGQGTGGVVRFKTNFNNSVLDVMHSLGWQRVKGDDPTWDVYWCDVAYARELPSQLEHGKNVRVCHFPTHGELTRKDKLVTNVKRYIRALERQEGKGAGDHCDFLPTTFQLPAEYHMFVQEFKRRPETAWIMKPVARAQGKGIFLFRQLSDIDEWKKDTRFSGEEEEKKGDSYIVSLYIENPYLISKRKFDLRFYVLVTSFSPLTVWLYREGFARFSGAIFTMDRNSIANNFIHLTNVAIQKTADGYDKTKGCKWLFSQVKRYLVSCHGEQAVEQCLQGMDDCFLESLKAVQPRMSTDVRCFEVYGYDILLDDNLKPWIIEVNASPSLTADTAEDYHMKYGMLEDLFTVLDVERRLPVGQEIRVGGFDAIHQNGNPVYRPSPYKSNEAKPKVNSFLGSYNGDRRENLAKVRRELDCTKQ